MVLHSVGDKRREDKGHVRCIGYKEKLNDYLYVENYQVKAIEGKAFTSLSFFFLFVTIYLFIYLSGF